MRQIFPFILGVLFLIPMVSFAGNPKFGPGTRIAYEVDYRGETYDFIVYIEKRDREGIRIRYSMTDDARTHGMIMLTSDALKESRAQNNYFNGSDLYLNASTTVWVSEKVYSELKDQKYSRIDPGEGEEKFNLTGEAKMDLPFGDKLKKVKVLIAESESGKSYWILDDKKNPLILKMNLGWKIDIKRVDLS